MGHDRHHSCSNGSCSSGSCSHGHSHSGKGCGCECCCHQGSSHEPCKFADELLQLADEAWMDLLKDKIKEEMRLNGGEQLTHLAKLVATANHARWKDKMQGKRDYEDFEIQLKASMCGNQKK